MFPLAENVGFSGLSCAGWHCDLGDHAEGGAVARSPPRPRHHSAIRRSAGSIGVRCWCASSRSATSLSWDGSSFRETFAVLAVQCVSDRSPPTRAHRIRDQAMAVLPVSIASSVGALISIWPQIDLPSIQSAPWPCFGRRPRICDQPCSLGVVVPDRVSANALSDSDRANELGYAARRSARRAQTSSSARDQALHQRVVVQRRRRDAQALGAARHGRVVDRLDVDAVLARAAGRRRACTAPGRRPAPARCGRATPSPAGRRRRGARFSVAARSWWRARSSALAA